MLRARGPTGASHNPGGEGDVGGQGAVGLRAIPVPLIQGSLGLTQLFSLMSSSHSALGIPEGFWENSQGKGI